MKKILSQLIHRRKNVLKLFFKDDKKIFCHSMQGIMFENLAIFSLFFSNVPCILTIFFIGMLSNKRNLFFWGAMFSLLSICINYALKITFKVPLPPELHDGYAFPSGHMQMLTVFYGWLAMHHLLRMRILFIPLCLMETYGLLYFHYHTLLEIVAGFITGLFLLSVFNRIFQKRLFHRYFLILLTWTGCFMYVYYFGVFKPHFLTASLVLSVTSIMGMLYSSMLPRKVS